MKKLLIGSTLTLAAALFAGCGEEEKPQEQDPNEFKLAGVIKENRTLKAGQTYTITEPTFVSAGAVLTIEPGATIKGERGSALVITPTSRIEAKGTAQQPIVFTSAQATGQRAPGDWGGVVLLGRARVNVTGGKEFIEGFQASEDPDRSTEYGGTNDAHNCGTLNYVRIEFAGFELAPDNELNGLTVAGCGSATALDYVQSHMGSDDGIEFFGGTANLKHAIVTGADDDSVDWDLGYTGNIQYLIIQQHDGRGDNGFESDSNGESPNAEPRSKPTIWNATLVGTTSAQKPIGLFLREGTGGIFHNFIVTNFSAGAVDVIDSDSGALYPNQLAIQHSLFFKNGGATTNIAHMPNKKTVNGVEVADVANFDERANFLASGTFNTEGDPMLESATSATAPNFKPKTGSPALLGDNAGTPPGGFFDASAKFIGAIGSTDWTAGWAAYPAN